MSSFVAKKISWCEKDWKVVGGLKFAENFLFFVA